MPFHVKKIADTGIIKIVDVPMCNAALRIPFILGKQFFVTNETDVSGIVVGLFVLGHPLSSKCNTCITE